MGLVRHLSLVMVVFVVVSCAGTGAGGGSERSQKSRVQETPPATSSSYSSASASPGRVRTFVGGKPDFVMLVQWEHTSESHIQGEMRKTDVEPTDPYGEGPPGLQSYETTFEGMVSGKTVILDVEFGDIEGGFPLGTWTGKLVEIPKGVNAPPGPALSLRPPGDYPILLSEGTEAEYARAVARLAASVGTSSVESTAP